MLCFLLEKSSLSLHYQEFFPSVTFRGSHFYFSLMIVYPYKVDFVYGIVGRGEYLFPAYPVLCIDMTIVTVTKPQKPQWLKTTTVYFGHSSAHQQFGLRLILVHPSPGLARAPFHVGLSSYERITWAGSHGGWVLREKRKERESTF